jgi:hypothetical protein
MSEAKFWTISISAVGVLITALMLIIPQYNVWQKGLAGEADLKKAEQTKLIMIETAKAEEDSARYRARAIEIMGEAAKKYPEYRQQEFMQAFGEALREGNIDQIIYVPTESNIPVLEAGKR